MGRADLDCATGWRRSNGSGRAIDGPIMVVAHSGGCIMVAHWARQTHQAPRSRRAAGHAARLRAADAGGLSDASHALQPAAGCRCRASRCRFRSIVAASRNDPLGRFERVAELARDWGSELVDLGEVGHLNPASGYGDWPLADTLIHRNSLQVR